MAAVRTYLGLHPGHAVASDDKKNGFNTMWRRAIFAGLRRWWPELIPAIRLWYTRRGRLSTFGKPATGPDEEANYSEEGCAQGDPLAAAATVARATTASANSRLYCGCRSFAVTRRVRRLWCCRREPGCCHVP